MVQVAVDQEKKGDPFHFAKATVAFGTILRDCFPERFAPPGEPPAKPTETAPPSEGEKSDVVPQ